VLHLNWFAREKFKLYFSFPLPVRTETNPITTPRACVCVYVFTSIKNVVRCAEEVFYILFLWVKVLPVTVILSVYSSVYLFVCLFAIFPFGEQRAHIVHNILHTHSKVVHVLISLRQAEYN
jgi:hypothetical protein